MAWTIKYSEIAAKQMQKLDKSISKKIDAYLTTRVISLNHPTMIGKPLLYDQSGLWRYRIENYRIICEIQETELIVLVLRLGHRKEIYKSVTT